VTPFQSTLYTIQASKIPAPPLLTILNVLEADHPMIINALIDQHRIENKILVSDRHQVYNQTIPSQSLIQKEQMDLSKHI
jgi:hypothetical protein